MKELKGTIRYYTKDRCLKTIKHIYYPTPEDHIDNEHWLIDKLGIQVHVIDHDQYYEILDY